MINIDYEEVELVYAIEKACYTLEEELLFLNCKHNQSIKILSESQLMEQDIILNEGVKEAVTKFLQSVSAAISKAWNAFKSLNVKVDVRDLVKANPDKLNSNFTMLLPKEFEVPELKIWDNLRQSITIKDFESNYDNWKQNENLKSIEDFVKKEYPDIYEENKNVAHVLHDKCFKTADPKEVVNSDLVVLFNNFLNEYPAQKEEIGNDIDTLNNSNNNILNRLKKIVSESNSYIGSNILSLLFEDGNNQQKTSKPNNENKFRSANPNDQQAENGKKELAEDRKNIIVYYKASTQVFSAKMKTCRDIEKSCEKIVLNFIKLQSNNKQEESKESNVKTDNTNQSTTIQK